jgi:hypothetical protein
MSDKQKGVNFYNAIRHILNAYECPSILTIPITGQRNRNFGDGDVESYMK